MRNSPSLCGHALGSRRHVCLLYSTAELEFAGLLRFVREGLAERDAILHIVSPADRAARIARLADNGVPCEEATADGRLTFRDWSDTYLADRPFSPEAMCARLRAALRSTHRTGFSRIRAWGDMRWIGEHPGDAAELLRYERLACNVASEFPDDILVCAYEVTSLAPKLLSDVTAIHPVVVFDHRMYENPR